MQVAYHGGACCGVKHIYQMYDPTWVSRAQNGKELTDLFHGDQSGMRYYNLTHNKYLADAPKESNEHRFYRILDFCVLTWKAHLIEVQIVEGWQSGWVPILEKCGFKRTSRHKNCNTGHWILSYSFAYDTDEESVPSFYELYAANSAKKTVTKAKNFFRGS